MGNFQKDRPDGLIRSGVQRPNQTQFVVHALDAGSQKGGVDA